MRWRLLILLGPLVSSGCFAPGPWVRPHQCQCYHRSIDECLASQTARGVARQHLSALYGCDENEPWPTCDFQAGFCEAYADVAMGSNGVVPVVPPAPYWKSCQRTAEGHQRAQEWLSGYTIGASHAMACRGPYNRVIASGSAVSCPPRGMSACGLGGHSLPACRGQEIDPGPQPTPVSQKHGPDDQVLPEGEFAESHAPVMTIGQNFRPHTPTTDRAE